MAQLGVNFDANRVAPMEAGYSVWEGRVPMQVMKTEIKPTSANDGNQMLVLTVAALDTPYVGQTNVIRLNLYNRNPQAVDMAQRELSSICHVTGRMQITDADQLIGAPFIGIWAKQTRDYTDKATGQTKTVDGCQVKDYELIDGRTIKEALAGQAAGSPYIRGQSGGPPQQAPTPQQAQHAPQPGFQQPTPQAGGAPPAGFATGGPVAGQAGGPPAGAAPGFGTAASGFNPPPAAAPAAGGFAPPQGGQQAPAGFAPPAGPQPGAGPWGPQAGGPAPGGFGAR